MSSASLFPLYTIGDRVGMGNEYPEMNGERKCACTFARICACVNDCVPINLCDSVSKLVRGCVCDRALV